MLAETRAELDDFHHSSKELEEELERELERTEKAQQELKVKVARAEQERDDWKVRIPEVAPRSVLDAAADQVYVSPNDAQHHDNIPSTRIGQATTRLPEDQGAATRARDGQRRLGAE